MTGLFISSTGTEIGKTLVTATLAYQLRMSRKPVTAIKPVISDFDESAPQGTDTALLAEAMGLPLSKETINILSPFRYRAPLAPSMAAALEGKTLNYDALIKACKTTLQQNPFTLIEGVGGSFVPLTGKKLVVDWIEDLALPSLLVIGSYLGTISHTIATLEAMHARGLSVTGIVMSATEGNDHPDLDKTADEIRGLTGLPLITITRLHGSKPWAKAPNLLPLL